jgi:hypothetical protein
VLLVTLPIFLIVTYSCGVKNENDKLVNCKEQRTLLADSMGSVDICIPLRYDTSFMWIDKSDCGMPCDTHKYRYQPKTLRIRKETGFYYTQPPPDTIDCLTISHSRYFPFHNGDSSQVINMHKAYRETLSAENRDLSFVYDTIRKINGRYFSVFALERFSSATGEKIVIASSTIKTNWIRFEFHTVGPSSYLDSHFIENSLSLLKSVVIEKEM